MKRYIILIFDVIDGFEFYCLSIERLWYKDIDGVWIFFFFRIGGDGSSFKRLGCFFISYNILLKREINKVN